MIELLHGDCMDYMKDCPDKSFDLAIVDPPYGVGDFSQAPRAARPFNKSWEIKWNNSVPDEDYFKEVLRVSKNQIVWGINYYAKYIDSVGRIVWDKCNASGVGSDCEIASQSFDVRVIKYTLQNTGFCGPERGLKVHPCQKPRILYDWTLKRYAEPGQRILDTHLGSGSSAIAAHYFGVDFVGIEIDEDYYKAAVERFNNETAQETLF